MTPLRSKHFINSIALRRDEVPDFGRHPFSVPAISGLEVLEFHPKVTFLVGENGSGKSTLLEALAEKLGFSLEGGSRNTNTAMHEYRSELTPLLTLSRTPNRPTDGFFLRAESFYNFASEVDYIEAQPFCGGLLESYGGKSLHAQSHGESFFALLNHRLSGHGVYLFDEPEAALSPQRQLSFLVRMHDLTRDSSQFVIATHSPFILSYPDAWIYQFTEAGIERVNYEDTDHYQITHAFMRDPKRMLQRLLAQEQPDFSLDS